MHRYDLSEALSSTSSLRGVELLLMQDVVEPDKHVLGVFKSQSLGETT